MSKLNELAETTGNEPIEPEIVKNIEPIENSPFVLVQKGDDYFIAMGEYRLTEMASKEDTLKNLDNIYELTLKMIIAVLDREKKN